MSMLIRNASLTIEAPCSGFGTPESAFQSLGMIRTNFSAIDTDSGARAFIEATGSSELIRSYPKP